jgi:hypothetical protein
MEDIVAQMRRDISTAPLKGDVFQVQYTGVNPVIVMKVTERLASSLSRRKSEGWPAPRRGY